MVSHSAPRKQAERLVATARVTQCHLDPAVSFAAGDTLVETHEQCHEIRQYLPDLGRSQPRTICRCC